MKENIFMITLEIVPLNIKILNSTELINSMESHLTSKFCGTFILKYDNEVLVRRKEIHTEEWTRNFGIKMVLGKGS